MFVVRSFRNQRHVRAPYGELKADQGFRTALVTHQAPEIGQRKQLALSIKKIAAASRKPLKVAAILFAGYLLMLTCAVLWAFEVKLARWPVFIYGDPYEIRVGDDIRKTRIVERLSRLGYVRSPVVATEPGQWSQSGSRFHIHLKYCPIRGRGIVNGPVSFSLDMNTIRSIRLARSLQRVESLTLEPELISVVPPRGSRQMLCRPVPGNEAPPLLVDAVILTEDRRFFSHHGIDPGSMFRALKTNVKAWRYVQGASTITQQLIKMTLLTPQKTLLRKTNEVFLALIADALYSKQTILSAYLDRVYLGHWGQFPINGVTEASRHLFGKELQKLNSEECAFLAATIMAPNIITPLRHPKRARARRNMILGLLLKEGKITRSEFSRAQSTPVRIRKPGPASVRATAFVELVKDSLMEKTGRLNETPLDILSSLDPLLQNKANLEIKRMGRQGDGAHLMILEPRTGEIKAYVAPGPGKWSGMGGNLEVVLPMITAAAFTTDKGVYAGLTLTSHLFPAKQGGRPITLREAFSEEKALLQRRLVDSIGRDKIIQTLKEFGIEATSNLSDSAPISRITPMEMAQNYALLATLGEKTFSRLRVRPSLTKPEISIKRRERISLIPASLFLVNHLLKDPRPLGDQDSPVGNSRSRPSIFTARDDEGLWGIAYRPDILLLVRLPGNRFDRNRVKRMMLRLLPKPHGLSAQPQQVPKDVVFRKICVDSGLRATSICPKVILEPFLKGTQPSEWCGIRHGSDPHATDGKAKSR
jgi:hypothetical protein